MRKWLLRKRQQAEGLKNLPTGLSKRGKEITRLIPMNKNKNKNILKKIKRVTAIQIRKRKQTMNIKLMASYENLQLMID